MKLCDFKEDYRINGRLFYADLHLEDLMPFSAFYVEIEDKVFDKIGNNAADLDFYLSLADAITICKRCLPESNAKRVLLKLQRYRRDQLETVETGYYSLRERVKELEKELIDQTKIAESTERIADKIALADAFLKGDNCVTAQEFNVILRQNGLAKTYPSTIFKTMERLGWIDNSGAIKHVPTPLGIDNGYVRLVQNVQHPRAWQYAPLMIATKGQVELLKHYKKLSKKGNIKPQNTKN